MPAIGSTRDQAGGLRIFFDLRPSETDPAEVVRITQLIEAAFTPQPTAGGTEVRAKPA
jgi:hypothetical protein